MPRSALSKRMIDTEDPNSLSSKFRKKRGVIIKTLLSQLKRPIKILDIGGRERFWINIGLADSKNLKIVLLNIEKEPVTKLNFSSEVGDARDLSKYRDKSFDVVFSNSVIEHVGGHKDQKQMAKETQRVGKHYIIQTPNKFFPIEPHFLFPLFQFLPEPLQIWMVRHFSIGNYPKIEDKEAAKKAVNGIQLLTKNELKALFQDARIYREKILFFTKSFIACHEFTEV